MIKKLHLKTMLLLCAMIMGIGSAWAETKSVDITPDDALNQGGVDPITVVCAKGDGTSNPAISSGQLRLYQAGSGKTTGNTITFSSEKTITKIVFTFANSMTADNGAFSEGAYDSSTFTWTGSTNSVTLTVTGTTSGTRIYITAMTVYYDDSVSQLTDSDFALTGAPVALSFDLYNNADAQTISYTTSSTGAVTVTASEYVEAVVNETAKTITVTPKKKSSEAQTITVSQTADNTYKAGSATFTVTIADSTPTTGAWVLTDLANLVEGDVFVIVGDNGDTYAMSNDKGTSGAPTAVAVTVEDDEISGTVGDNIKWNISGNANDGYTFYPNGSTETWLYCTNTNNGVRVGTGDAKHFTLTTGNNAGYLTTTETTEQRYIGIYNSSDWRCYSSINANIKDQTFAFYKYSDNSGVQAPSITASNVSITYNATTGEIAYTLKNEVTDGSLNASVTSGDWLTLGSGITSPITFTCSANEATEARTATVTLTYTYGDNETVTKEVTVTQAAAPILYTTIPDIFDAATSTATDVNVTFDNWVVSGVSGSNAYVTDNNGNGFIIYTSNHGFEVNDKLSGTVSGTPLKSYNGAAEFTSLTASTTGLTVSQDGSITVITDKAITDLGGVNTGAVISLSNLTYDGTNLSDGTNSIKPYTTLYNGTFESGKTYNVTGVYLQYNNTKEILPRSADDIVEVAAPTMEYTLTVTASDNVEIFTFVGDTSNEGVEGATTLQVSNGTEVGLSVSATQGYELKLSVDGIDVTSLLDDTGFYTFTMPTHNVTVSATAVAPDVPVDPAVAGVGAFVKVTDAADITSGNYLIVYEAGNIAFKGSLETLDAVGNTIDVTIVGDKIPATATTVASTFTIQPNSGTLQSASGKYVYIDSYSNGLKQSDDKPSLANSFDINDGNALITVETSGGKMTMKYNSASNQDRFRYYKSGQNDIQLYKYVATEQAIESISITVSSAGYATYCSADALDFSNTGLTAYRATISSDNQVNFIEVTEVPAKEGVLLKGAANTYDVPIIASAEPIENDLIGVTKNTKVEETGIFVLLNGDYGVGFYKTTASSFTVGAHTAYFPALPSGARNFIAIDEATAIKAIESKQQNGEIYNLAGQRVKSAQKGLYIIDGKKVVIK